MWLAAAASLFFLVGDACGVSMTDPAKKKTTLILRGSSTQTHSGGEGNEAGSRARLGLFFVASR